MNTKTKAILLASLVGLFSSCTQNQRAKSYGGSATIDLPAGTKLVHATWKEDQLWYLYRLARPGEKPEYTTFKESASYGVLEGQVIFKEK